MGASIPLNSLSPRRDTDNVQTFGVCAIFFGVFGIGIFFFVPETSYVRPAAANQTLQIAKEAELEEKAGNLHIEHQEQPAYHGKLTGNGTAANAATEAKHSYWRSLALFTGRYSNGKVWKIFARPLVVFWYPAVLFSFLLYGTTLTWIVVFSVVRSRFCFLLYFETCADLHSSV